MYVWNMCRKSGVRNFRVKPRRNCIVFKIRFNHLRSYKRREQIERNEKKYIILVPTLSNSTVNHENTNPLVCIVYTLYV